MCDQANCISDSVAMTPYSFGTLKWQNFWEQYTDVNSKGPRLFAGIPARTLKQIAFDIVFSFSAKHLPLLGEAKRFEFRVCMLEDFSAKATN